MSIKKRMVITALCLAACLTTIPIPQAKAADIDVSSTHSDVMPFMEYISNYDFDFVISNGKARITARMDGYLGITTKCKVTVELQEKGLLFWNTVKTFNAVEYRDFAEVDTTYNVTSDKTYRLDITFTAWSSTDSETQTMTSESIKA